MAKWLVTETTRQQQVEPIDERQLVTTVPASTRMTDAADVQAWRAEMLREHVCRSAVRTCGCLILFCLLFHRQDTHERVWSDGSLIPQINSCILPTGATPSHGHRRQNVFNPRQPSLHVFCGGLRLRRMIAQ